jgi:hypothetical protein
MAGKRFRSVQPIRQRIKRIAILLAKFAVIVSTLGITLLWVVTGPSDGSNVTNPGRCFDFDDRNYAYLTSGFLILACHRNAGLHQEVWSYPCSNAYGPGMNPEPYSCGVQCPDWRSSEPTYPFLMNPYRRNPKFRWVSNGFDCPAISVGACETKVDIPLGWPTLTGWLLCFWILIGFRRYRRRLRRGNCLRCGYDLTGNTSGLCPECGTRVTRPTSDRFIDS